MPAVIVTCPIMLNQAVTHAQRWPPAVRPEVETAGGRIGGGEPAIDAAMQSTGY
jgi:hypothetical protein